MAFTINNKLVFVDCGQFMNSSLNTLAKNLSHNDFKYLSQEFSGDVLELVKQKGVYPYEYMDSFEKLFEKKLPDRYDFFSSIKDKFIGGTDYLYSINIWSTFKINTIGDYHDF